MSTRSMTGFARVRRDLSGIEASVSLKSVNHRGLDMHFSLPPSIQTFEAIAREALKVALFRGHVQVQVTLDRKASPFSAGETRSGLNTALLRSWCAAFEEASLLLGVEGRPDPSAALRLPGMFHVEIEREWPAGLDADLSSLLHEAIAELNSFRQREGEAIALELRDRTRALEDLCVSMEEIRATATQIFHRRLTDRLSQLLRGEAIEPQRLAQEAALLAEKSDISEEVLRLKTHAAQVRRLIDAPGEKGKKLDFLLQEMNRETNTVLSKTGGLGDHGLKLTDLALAAKAEIDKMREQSLNLE